MERNGACPQPCQKPQKQPGKEVRHCLRPWSALQRAGDGDLQVLLQPGCMGPTQWDSGSLHMTPTCISELPQWACPTRMQCFSQTRVRAEPLKLLPSPLAKHNSVAHVFSWCCHTAGSSHTLNVFFRLVGLLNVP